MMNAMSVPRILLEPLIYIWTEGRSACRVEVHVKPAFPEASELKG